MFSEKVLAVKNLVKSYHGIRAVDGISFGVVAGEIVGLLGPNGAGKTSTINMILGLLEPDAGEISVFGKNFKTHRSEILSKVSFAAVYAQLPGNLWVEQNLRIFAILYGIPNPKKKVQLLMQEFELTQFARSKTAFLSYTGLSPCIVLRSRILLVKKAMEKEVHYTTFPLPCDNGFGLNCAAFARCYSRHLN